MISVRQGYVFGFISISCFIGFVYFLQYQGFMPCPLCILQRILMFSLSIVFFMGMLWPFKKIGNIIICSMGLLLTTAGMILATRQSWLQYMPPRAEGECGVSLQYLLNILPVSDVAKMVWQGGTECSEVGWLFLGLSLAEWSLILFGLFFIFIMLQLKRSLKQ